MLPLAAVVFGALIGFVGSRALRRPQHAADAASVARAVGGTLGRRRGLGAPDLQRACLSEMVRHVREGSPGTSVAPARYELRLHPTDVEVVDDARGWFIDGLADALQAAATQNGWTLAGAVDIRIVADGTRRPGVPTALAIDPPRAKPAAETIALERTDSGERIVLRDDEVTIGRAADRSVVIDDTRVSRGHAVVARGRNGWAVTDMGSSNGTTVNGRLLTPNVAHPLVAGDAIGIGPIELLVVAGQVLRPPRRPRS